MKGDYEEFCALKAEKNKANSKPIASQFTGEAEPAQAIPKAFGFEAATQGTFEKTKPIYERAK